MPKKLVNASRLRALGFPEETIREAIRAENLGLLGLLEMEPSPDLVERTIRRCEAHGAFRRTLRRNESLVRQLLGEISKK